MLTRKDIRPTQQGAIDFICDGDDALILADVGTGKTLIGLTAAEQCLLDHLIKRWLVLAPKRVATDVWVPETDEWEHLLDVPIECAVGDEAHRKKVINGGAEIVVLNYENLFWLLEQFPLERTIKTIDGKRRTVKTEHLPFDGLICDEIDKLKDVSSKRFKAFRDRLDNFEKIVGLTGTPTANKLTEIWSPAFIVDGTKPRLLGNSFYKWRREYFYPIDYNQHQWKPFPDTFETVTKTLSGLVYRIEAEGLPPVFETPPRYVALPTKIKPLYKELERELYAIIFDRYGDERVIDADNQAVLQGKLQQLTAGFSYVPPKDRCDSCGAEVKLNEKKQWRCTGCPKKFFNDTVWHSKKKFDELDGLISELMGQQLMIIYHFKAEREELARRYKGRIRFLGGGVTDKEARETIEQWNSGELELLGLHPASGGHGLNLQKSGAHHIAGLTLPWSGGMYKQVVGRLARTGQVAETVFVHPILVRHSVDDLVLATATEKLDGQQQFLDAFKTRQ